MGEITVLTLYNNKNSWVTSVVPLPNSKTAVLKMGLRWIIRHSFYGFIRHDLNLPIQMRLYLIIYSVTDCTKSQRREIIFSIDRS